MITKQQPIIREEGTVYFIYHVEQIASIVTMFICLLRPSVYSSALFCLPLAFLLINIIFRRNYYGITRNIVKLLIITFAFIRLVLLPLTLIFVDVVQVSKGINITSYLPQATFLMIYEYFCVQLSIFAYENIQIKGGMPRFVNRITANPRISYNIILVVLIYTLLILVLLPETQSYFKNILSLWNSDYVTIIEKTSYSTGSIKRILTTLFSLSFSIIRIVFPALLLKSSYNKGNDKAILVLLISCLLQFFFLTSTFSEAIVACLAIILYYIRLFPERRKRVLLLLIISTFGIMLLYFLVRYYINAIGQYTKDSGLLLYAGQIINAYFGGIENVAKIFSVDRSYAGETFYSGLISSIPFNSTLFGAHGNRLQYYFNEANNTYGQIQPTIGAGYYYFGYVFSPIISMAFTILGLKYNEKSNHFKSSLKGISYIFCAIVFALGTAMYSETITLSWFLQWGVPMILVCMFDNETYENYIE